MQELSDEALVALYRAGNHKAMDILLERYKNLVRHKAKAMFIVGGDRDDLIQEGMIGLYKAVRDYEADKNAAFLTFASMCINRQMCTAVVSANRKKYQPLNGSISLDMMVNGEGDSDTTVGDMVVAGQIDNPEDIILDREEYEELLRSIEEKLSVYERQVLALYMDGYDYIDIAKRLDKHPKSVDNAIQRLKNKIALMKK